jgi:hypothetical protein
MKEKELEKFSKLTKKLEEISLPEIELPTHKRKLKETLLSKYCKEKRRQEFFAAFWRLAPIGAMAIFLGVIIFTKIISPVYTTAQVQKIAFKNPQIKEILTKGAIVSDVKIVNSKGFILLQSSLPAFEMEKEDFEKLEREVKTKKESIGILAEIDLKGKKVTKIEEISSEIVPLPQKEKVKKIFEKNQKAQKILPKEAEIKEIIPLTPPELRLIREKKKIKVVPILPRKAKVIYQLNEKRWEGKIDLIKEELEELKFLGETER